MTENGKQIVTAWIRRRANRQGPDGVSHFADAYERVKRLYELWDARFPDYPYLEFRTFLANVARANTVLPTVDDWTMASSEWIAPIDDDDWHLPGLADALALVPNDFVMACWPVIIANLTRDPCIYIEPIHWGTGPHSCGYAVRKKWLESLSPRQVTLIRDDHRHVHRYVDFSGEKYLFLDKPFGQYVFTPASISSIPSADAEELNIATRDEYATFAIDCPPGVKEVAEFLATI